MNKKNILVIPHLFYPEYASTAQVYSELFKELEEDFNIMVLCAVPCYTGKIEDKYKTNKVYHDQFGKINIIRVAVKEFDKTKTISRVLHIYSYYKNAKNEIKKLPKFDVTFVCSQPPILGGLLGRYAKKKTKSKLIYNIQDFNPEQAKAVVSKFFRPALYFLGKIDNKSCKKSDLIITVGRDMQQTLINRFKNKNVPNNIVINNWVNEKIITPLDEQNELIQKFKAENGMLGKKIVMYSGNLGLYYDLENICKVLLKYKNNPNLLFVFIGEGGSKENLQKLVAENQAENFIFLPYQPKSFLKYSLNSADIHLVTNAKGIKGISVPSKIYSCLATNKPIIGILENGSEAYKIIHETNCGITIPTGDYKTMEQQLDIVFSNVDKFVAENDGGRKLVEEKYSMDISVKLYKESIANL